MEDEKHATEPSSHPPGNEGSENNPAQSRRILHQWTAVCLVILALALCGQGARGLADPDEGFYSNVAIGMVESGDWWLPRLNGDLFLDKPPMLYWGIGLGVRLLGRSEWAARAIQGLWFAATALLVGLLAKELWGQKLGPPAALGYAVTLGPFIGANILTPDTILCFWTVFAVLAYWKFLKSKDPPQYWWRAMLLGFALGCGALAKGPAILLIVPPIGLHMIWTQGRRSLLRLESLLVIAIAIAIGGSWYLSVGLRVEGAFPYWFDNQVAGRLWSDSYQRFPRWWGSLRIYAPALLLGLLPWTPLLIWRGAKRLSQYRLVPGGSVDTEKLLLLLWFLLPMAVLVVARSRLPLYVLPVFPPLVLLAVRMVFPPGGVGSRRRAVLLTVWIVALMGLKLGAAHRPTYKDTRMVARGLTHADIPPTTPIVAVDVKTNALRFYGWKNLHNARLWAPDYPYFVHWETLDTVLESTRNTDRLALVALSESDELLRNKLRDIGFSCTTTRLPKKYSILDCRSSGDLSQQTGKSLLRK